MSHIDESVFLAQGSVVTGNVSVGADCSIWYNAVLRGDEASITIGKRSNVQECCVIHESEGLPVTIGEGVTIGHGAIVHGCTVGDNTLIGMGAILLDGSKVGRNCIIGAGALVTQGMEIPDGSLAFGSPARVVRELTEDEINSNTAAANLYIARAREAKAKLTV